MFRLLLLSYRLLGIAWLFVPSALCAQWSNLHFNHLDVNNGLSHNQVNAIYKDNKGFLWFGTMAGLNRYDGYRFKVFRHSSTDTTSINDNYIVQISPGHDGKMWVNTRAGWNLYDPTKEQFVRNPQALSKEFSLPNTNFSDVKATKDGSYWFVYAGNGLYQYNPATKKNINLTSKNSSLLHSRNVVSIAEGNKGYVWIIYADGILEQFDPKNNRVVRTVRLIDASVVKVPADFRLFVDAQGDVWLYILSDSEQGIHYYNSATGTITVFNKDAGKWRLNNNVINGITQDDKGLIWVATDHGGVNIINKRDLSVKQVMNNPEDAKSIAHNSIYSIYKDNTGIIWIGTFKNGISLFHESFVEFPLYKHKASDKASLPFEDVNRFAEDAKGNLWIGTNGGGLIYFDRATGKYTHYVHNENDPNSLSNDVIVSLWIDKQQKLWIGTYFGGLNCFDGNKFTHFRHDDKDSNSIADDRIWEIYEDSKGRLWVGTLASGLDMFDREKNNFVHYKPFGANSIQSFYISSIEEDHLGNLWFGTAYGISKLNNAGKFSTYLSNDGDKKSLSNNNVIAIHEDSRGFIWVGTRDGLNLLNTDGKSFTRFTTANGLPDNTILAILEDKYHNLWLSTPNGLSNLIISSSPSSKNVSYLFKNYDENDGLQGRVFNESAAWKTRSGELLFGGPNGFNVFYPKGAIVKRDKAKIVFTDLQLFNKTVGIGEELNGHTLLPKAISEIGNVRLKHMQDVFSIEFAALDFQNAGKIKYAYKLEGFNKEWLTTDANNRRATFTNLDPGTYIFKVKIANEDGSWSDEESSLKITILPPFWKTPLAYIIYVLLAAATLFFARQIVLRRARAKFAIEQERREAHRLHELDMLKIKFFTNISHEFRTPLSLILAPLEKIIRTSEAENKKQLTLIQRNAKRLLNLVNLLLDFRKMEVQEFKLHPSEGDLVHFIKDLTYSFSDIAEKKHIDLSFCSSDATFITNFDKDKMEKIVFNLLSNAFRFSKDGGSVAVSIVIDAGSTASEKRFMLKVADTGIGIPAEEQEKIFERFFQHDIPGNIVNQGSGIGLAITKEFVKLSNGTITVNSEPEKGSCFTVSLPFEVGAQAAKEPVPIRESIKALIEQAEPEQNNGGAKRTTILLVEDNEDFRFYLKDNLKGHYNIVEAVDGKEGWKKVTDVQPELVVSDIMMPNMNGLDLAKKMKNDARTSHIPIVLLTAMASEEQQLEGFESGANDYITKPFSFEILLSRIKSLLNQRKLMRKAFQKGLDVNPAEITVTPLDEQFIKDALAIVEANISNAEFSVEEFSRSMHMSRVALYKKLVSITGRPPLEFIRSIRLKRAAQLLLKTKMTVAEVAYETGFNNPKYFTRYFKEEFNSLPSQYASKQDVAI